MEDWPPSPSVREGTQNQGNACLIKEISPHRRAELRARSPHPVTSQAPSSNLSRDSPPGNKDGPARRRTTSLHARFYHRRLRFRVRVRKIGQPPKPIRLRRPSR
ncbi:hypothetical protein EVAR_61728_1 [Eumeta japonica]|uniref:Uncharacterized protein n=1 Tax=Eumeta variegata TaxID=151549 RepID=A0A4C1ZP85_EUMVA|nr:hypothetical protein EVAR_61728_1 [Eumeta japonica]